MRVLGEGVLGYNTRGEYLGRAAAVAKGYWRSPQWPGCTHDVRPPAFYSLTLLSHATPSYVLSHTVFLIPSTFSYSLLSHTLSFLSLSTVSYFLPSPLPAFSTSYVLYFLLSLLPTVSTSYFLYFLLSLLPTFSSSYFLYFL